MLLVWCISVCARPGTRAQSECSCAIGTKWRLRRHLETPVELPVSLFDSFSEFICNKGSISFRYRVDWCINHRLQSSVGVLKKRWRFDRFPCITVAVLWECCWVEKSLANHDQIPKKAYIPYVRACEGFSYVWRHRRVRAIPT